MADSTMSPVVHNVAHNRFEVNVDGQLSVLEYRLTGSIMAITHTFVPATQRGRGIAEMLMKAAITTATVNNQTIDPLCSYAARYLERHPLTK